MSSPEAGPAIEMEVRLDAPPPDVFPYFVEPERYVRWQGIKAELDPRPGGVYRVWMDENTVAEGEYVEVRSPTRIVFTWGWRGDPVVPPGSTTVEFTLSAERYFTGRLSTLVRGEDPRPMPPRPD